MTLLQAETIFYEYGEVVEKNHILNPEKYGSNLKSISRNEIRRAIMLWVAKQKFEGRNIILQSISSPDGKKVAILDLAVNLWHMSNMFQLSEKSIRDGTAKIDSSEDRKRAAKEWNDFQDLIIKIEANDANYWNKILNQNELNHPNSLPNINENPTISRNLARTAIGYVVILFFLAALILLIAIT
jgi:hypothetical protein